MYSLDELNERIDYLKKISAYINKSYDTEKPKHYKAKELFSELEETIKAYLNRDYEFELQVHKTLDKVVAEVFHSEIIYEHQELIDVWKTPTTAGVPTGFNDIRELFKGDEVFEEIMTVTDKDFKLKFYRIEDEDENEDLNFLNTDDKDSSDKDDDDSKFSATKYGNTYLESWIEKLKLSKMEELAGLKMIMQHCANRSYNVEWAILFEEHGKNINPHPVRYYAKKIFVEKGYYWLIKTFNLNIYRPSYISDLLD